MRTWKEIITDFSVKKKKRIWRSIKILSEGNELSLIKVAKRGPGARGLGTSHPTLPTGKLGFIILM